MEKPKTQAETRHQAFLERAAGARLLAQTAIDSIDSVLGLTPIGDSPAAIGQQKAVAFPLPSPVMPSSAN